MQPENGNLAQRWVALPAWLSGAHFPYLDQEYWRKSDSWVMGHEFFYETGEDHFPRLMAARAMTALLSVGLGALVFLWSRQALWHRGGLRLPHVLRLQPDAPRPRGPRDERRLHGFLHAGERRGVVAAPDEAGRRPASR